jgi:hypothetical protein
MDVVGVVEIIVIDQVVNGISKIYANFPTVIYGGIGQDVVPGAVQIYTIKALDRGVISDAGIGGIIQIDPASLVSAFKILYGNIGTINQMYKGCIRIRIYYNIGFADKTVDGFAIHGVTGIDII